MIDRPTLMEFCGLQKLVGYQWVAQADWKSVTGFREMIDSDRQGLSFWQLNSMTTGFQVSSDGWCGWISMDSDDKQANFKFDDNQIFMDYGLCLGCWKNLMMTGFGWMIDSATNGFLARQNSMKTGFQVWWMIGMSCPSWQWHRTGSSWSPVRTLPVAPLPCDLGFFPNSRGNHKAAGTSALEYQTWPGLPKLYDDWIWKAMPEQHTWIWWQWANSCRIVSMAI